MTQAAPQPVVVPFNMGCNLSDPRTILRQGELVYARNSHYFPESQLLAKTGGINLVGTISGNPEIRGVSFVSFRSAGTFLIVAAGSGYYTMPLSGPGYGTLTQRATLTSPVGQMEAVYFNGTDRVYVSDGVNVMQVWSGSGNMRSAGLTAPSDGTVAFVAGSSTEYQQALTYSYVHTEYDSTNDIESAPSNPVVVLSASASGSFQYTFPTTQTNASFDKYRLYRTENGGTIFFRLAEVANTDTDYFDGVGAGANQSMNSDVWGSTVDTVSDAFLSTQPLINATGEPLKNNYMTANGTIPIGDQMLVFENQLVISGVPGYEQDVYQSLPDFPESFSPVSWFRSENGRGDPISGIGVAQDRFLIFHLNSIFRVNTLPGITDPGFGLGLARRELVTDDNGCVAKRSIVNFGVGQPNNRVFYLSNRGPMFTDGYSTIPVGEDLDWSSRYFNMSRMKWAKSFNFPKYRQIWLCVPSAGSQTNDIALIYHYDPNHIKKGAVGKWLLPTHIRVSDAATAYATNDETRVFIGDTKASGSFAGTIYEIDQGIRDDQENENSDGDINWEWMTGDVPMQGESRAFRVQRLFLDVRGTDTEFSPTLKMGIDQKAYEKTIPLTNRTKSRPSLLEFGQSMVHEQLQQTFRGIPLTRASQFRWHVQELAKGHRQVVALELETQPFGKER